MGVDVDAISKAVHVVCRGGDDCDETHYHFCPHPAKRREGLKPGCHIVGKGGRSFGFWAANYAEYDDWRRSLSLLALGVHPEEVWQHPRRFHGKPFVELINFPDTVGPCIGPITSKKLHADFVAFASKAKKHLPSALRRLARSQPKPHLKKHANRAGLADTEELTKAIGGVILSTSEETDRPWMWELYCDFRYAFKLASNDGFVSFG
jgi:hypothetical protein